MVIQGKSSKHSSFRYIRSQVMQGRWINCPFLGKFVKRSIIEAGKRLVGGPKRGDQPFTASFFGENLVEEVASTSYGHKKYAYMPAIDLLEIASMMYKEDIENMSPLSDSLGVKVIQISYSSIAAACNCSKTAVMNCLKEIFSNMLYLVKQGNEITLDLKIGTLNIMKDSKLMFRNYNPDVKIDRKRNQSQAGSQRSAIPTSVATPMTDMNSTLSFRGQSQDVSARLGNNHIGIKRSGPAYKYNADLHISEGEKVRLLVNRIPSNLIF